MGISKWIELARNTNKTNYPRNHRRSLSLKVSEVLVCEEPKKLVKIEETYGTSLSLISHRIILTPRVRGFNNQSLNSSQKNTERLEDTIISPLKIRRTYSSAAERTNKIKGIQRRYDDNLHSVDLSRKKQY